MDIIVDGCLAKSTILFHFSQGNTPTIIVLQVLSPHPEATNYLLKESLSKI